MLSIPLITLPKLANIRFHNFVTQYSWQMKMQTNKQASRARHIDFIWIN